VERALGEGREAARHTMTPKTTTIGSYPAFPRAEDIEYFEKMKAHGITEELVDPYLWSLEETIRDFTASGIEVVSTGQTRGDLYSIFLDPRFVKGVGWKGAEAFVSERIQRVSSIRAMDVRYAREMLPDQFELKEPITDAYTLAKFAKLRSGSYRDTRDLARAINREIILPEIEDLQGGGSVSMIQLDSPTISSESSTPEYLLDLYEEVAGVAKVPTVLHACGDTARLFRLLTRTKVDVLSLDFYHYPRLLEEVSSANFDQRIGVGALDAQSPRIEGVEEIKSVMGQVRTGLGDERVSLVHPHCGQRSLDREVAFAKNSNLTIARDDIYFGEAEEARPHRLTRKEYDRKGYFLVSVKRESGEILATFYSYAHKVVRRYKSRQAEKILQSINEEADRLGISRRHLAYITLELGRAEASLQSPHLAYRQRMVE